MNREEQIRMWEEAGKLGKLGKLDKEPQRLSGEKPLPPRNPQEARARWLARPETKELKTQDPAAWQRNYDAFGPK